MKRQYCASVCSVGQPLQVLHAGCVWWATAHTDLWFETHFSEALIVSARLCVPARFLYNICCHASPSCHVAQILAAKASSFLSHTQIL